MNNYSWLQQRLHKLALSSQFMREVSFDAESSLISKIKDQGNHVFVAGLARSGTTILLNAIYQSNEFGSLTYADMPFILAPNLWSKISLNTLHTHSAERAHGDSIKVSSDSPEAFEEVFWKTFRDSDSETQKKFMHYIQCITLKYKTSRYLSKNNQNIRRLALISEIFPNSKILIPFRHPTQQAYSLLTQHKNFIEKSKGDNFISSYMKWIGHTEFGPNYIPIQTQNIAFKNNLNINHWLEQWYLAYKNCLDSYSKENNLHYVCYESLCESERAWFEIRKLVGIRESYDFSFRQSIKKIPLTVDSDLYKRCMAVYEELQSASL